MKIIAVNPVPPKERKLMKAASAELDRLKEAGKTCDEATAHQLATSQSAGYESLVQFQGAKTGVASFADLNDLKNFADLHGGGPVSPELQTRYQALQQRGEQGDEFFLQRQGKLLKADPAGAAVVMARGEAVVRQDVAGARETWTTVPSVVAAPAPKAAAWGNLLAQAADLKLNFQIEAEDKDESLLSRLRPQRGSAPRAELVQALEQGQRLLVSLPQDERKIPLPLAVDGEGLKTFVQYLSSPSPEQKGFQSAFADLQSKDAVMMARSNSGELKGMMTQADHRSAYLTLLSGQDMLVLNAQGQPQPIKQPEQLLELSQKGKLPQPALEPNQEQPGSNLMMVYHVAPFDPINKGIYDDVVVRMSEIGSSPRLDIVSMRSDLPDKRNLLVEKVEKGRLQELKRLDPNTVMSDPATLSEFVAETLLANQDSGKVRLFVGGHGGAEKGLLPDGKDNNAAADNAMSVDDFAGSIKTALDRVEKETGKRPFIENLVLCSCLMGNTSLIDALAQTGDVGVLCASPEVMMGSSPTAMIEYLDQPEHKEASGEEFARYLVETVSQAPSAPGGKQGTHHADTYGAYRLDQGLAGDFKKSMNGFFQACLDNPDQAEAVKRAIAACPTYGVNPLVNLLFDVDNRDVIQVAERIVADARVTSKEVKEAANKMIEAASAQVIVQNVSSNYEGRKGPSIYLPVDRFDHDPKRSQTDLLKTTEYGKFCEMIFDAPLYRGLSDSFLTDVGEGIKAFAKSQEGKELKPEELEKDSQVDKDEDPNQLSPRELGRLEVYREDNALKAASRSIRAIASGAVGLAGGLALAAVGAVPGAVVGAFLGAQAGLSGHSLVAKRYGGEAEAPKSEAPKSEAPKTDTPKSEASPEADIKAEVVAKGARLLAQAALVPAETVGINVHEKVGFRFGEIPARLLGGLAGTVGGAVGGACVGGAVGLASGFFLGYVPAQALTAWMPGQLPDKEPQGGVQTFRLQ